MNIGNHEGTLICESGPARRAAEVNIDTTKSSYDAKWVSEAATLGVYAGHNEL